MRRCIGPTNSSLATSPGACPLARRTYPPPRRLRLSAAHAPRAPRHRPIRPVAGSGAPREHGAPLPCLFPPAPLPPP
eukprot:scaffold27647_cov110-Isochrysis_galbana.AAC.1